MNDGEPAIRVRGLVRDYGRVRALAGLDLAVARGEVYGLLGNNGAGKTTTLHVLLGLLRPHAGEVAVLGLDPARERLALQQRVGFFPETDRPYDWLRVSELLRVGELAFRGWDREHAEALRRRFELPATRAVKELSKGMVAKAKLLLALAHRPELLLLDEPTSGLDPSSRHELLEHLAAVAGAAGATVVLSSHNLDDVERVAGRVGILDGGRLAIELGRDDVRRMSIVAFAGAAGVPPPAEPRVWTRSAPGGEEWLVADLDHPGLAPALAGAAAAGTRVAFRPASLLDAFVFITRRSPAAATESAA